MIHVSLFEAFMKKGDCKNVARKIFFFFLNLIFDNFTVFIYLFNEEEAKSKLIHVTVSNIHDNLFYIYIFL